MNLMQGQCKPNAESSLYAEVQPVLAYRRQSYGVFILIPRNFSNSSPTCSDNRPHRRQINVLYYKCVANSVKFVHILSGVIVTRCSGFSISFNL